MLEYLAKTELTANELAELESFEKKCETLLYYNACGNLDFPCFHMMVDENGQIVSYLGIYGIDGENVEISGATLPQYRRKGLFRRLIRESFRQLSTAGIKNIYSSLHPQLSYLDFRYAYSEYLLTKKHTLAPQPCVMTMSIREFDRSKGDELDLCYVIYFMDTPAGMFRICGSTDFACIHRVRVRKSFRGQGYGTTLIRCGLEIFFNHYPCDVHLHVSSQNTAAVRLYRQCGFRVKEEIAFYRCHMKD